MEDRARDELLVVRCQLGERDAFAELVARWYRPLWTFIWRLNGDAGRTDDLTQEVWIRVVRGLPALRSPGQFPSWVFRIARRTVVDDLRATHRQVEVSADAEVDETAAPPDRDDVDALLARIDLSQALARLRLNDRETVVLFHLNGLRLEEVAEILDVPVGTVKSRLHRSRRQLATQLGDEETGP